MFDLIPRQDMSAERHPYRGKMLTVPEIANMAGLSISTIRRRLDLGQPLEGRLPLGPTPKRYLFRGQMLTTSEIVAETGWTRATVQRRVSGNMILEGDAAKAGFDDTHHLAFALTYGNITDSISGWARRTGFPRHVISERLGRKGWPVQRILTEPPIPKSKRFSFGGKSLTLPQWADETGIRYTLLKDRILKGWSIGRALIEPVVPPKERSNPYHANRRIIRWMVIAFRISTHTGGYNQTFARGYGTGVGRRVPDLQSSQNGMDRQ